MTMMMSNSHHHLIDNDASRQLGNLVVGTYKLAPLAIAGSRTGGQSSISIGCLPELITCLVAYYTGGAREILESRRRQYLYFVNSSEINVACLTEPRRRSMMLIMATRRKPASSKEGGGKVKRCHSVWIRIGNNKEGISLECPLIMKTASNNVAIFLALKQQDKRVFQMRNNTVQQNKQVV